MVEELFSEEGVCTIRWDERIETVVVEWEGDVSDEAYRDAMDELLDAIADREASKLLTDSRKQGLMDESDQTWTVEDWEPRALDAGLESIAVVYPEDRSARTTVDMSARKRPHTDLGRLFTDDPDEARNWLRTK